MVVIPGHRTLNDGLLSIPSTEIFPGIFIPALSRILIEVRASQSLWQNNAVGGLIPEILEKEDFSTGNSFDLLFVDLKEKEVTEKGYFSNLLQHTIKDSVFIVWNIRESGLISDLWKEIKEDPEVKVTVDLFKLGVVFFRDELSKEDFILHF